MICDILYTKVVVLFKCEKRCIYIHPFPSPHPPALGLAFVPLGSKGLTIPAIRFTFNIYTGSGYLNAVLGIINLVMLIFVQNIKAQSFTSTPTSTMTINSNTGDKRMVKVSSG